MDTNCQACYCIHYDLLCHKYLGKTVDKLTTLRQQQKEKEVKEEDRRALQEPSREYETT